MLGLLFFLTLCLPIYTIIFNFSLALRILLDADVCADNAKINYVIDLLQIYVSNRVHLWKRVFGA